MELRITEIKEEAADVKSFLLEPVGGGSLRFKAGQFLTFLHQDLGREFRRSYSLSAAAVSDAPVRITVKRIPNGVMSRWLCDRACVGDTLRIEGGATGVFTLPEDLSAYEAVWLFAAGIGITPIYAIVEELLFRHSKPVVLVYSNHSKADTVFYESILRLQEQFPERLRVAWLWSDARDLRRARLSKESFPLLLAEHLHGDPQQAICYVCGPASYMWLVQLLLQDCGVPSDAVRRELFIVDKAVRQRLPADKGPHRVTLRHEGAEYSFINAYPDSILRSARNAGIPLPYSCETGQCGSCTLLCRQGKVWMSYNEVLTEKDLLSGRVLTCTGHAVGGDVVLET